MLKQKNHSNRFRPEDEALCLPVYSQKTGEKQVICTSLDEFPVYMLQGGVNDFFKALILQKWQTPIDWSFVDDAFDRMQQADDVLAADELEIVQKRLMMWIRGRFDASRMYELG